MIIDYLALSYVAIAAIMLYTAYPKKGSESRTQAMTNFALRQGHRFGEAPPHHCKLPAGKVFGRDAATGKPQNVISAGECAGTHLYFLDFFSPARDEEQPLNAAFTLAVAVLNEKRLPPFELRPEGFTDKLPVTAAAGQVDVSDLPVFAGKYILSSPKPDLARAFFHYNDRAKAFAARHGWHLQSAGGTLLLARGLALQKPGAYQAFIDDTKALLGELAP